MNINGATQLFGIIGNPVKHSLSPVMHNAAFSNLGYNGVYIPIQNKNIGNIIEAVRTLGFCGASVTIPFKEEVMHHIDEIDPIAQTIGAVNTLVFATNSTKIKGFNTDWLGSNKALEKYIDLKNSSALIIGAGGAAKAVAYGLVHAGAKVTIANRTKEKATKLAAELGCSATSLSNTKLIDADILINTTSIGMAPDIDGIPVFPEQLSQYKVVMDIVYSPLKTKLLQEAERRDCTIIDGLAMLLYQGIEQFRLWTGKQPSEEIMHKALLDALVIK